MGRGARRRVADEERADEPEQHEEDHDRQPGDDLLGPQYTAIASRSVRRWLRALGDDLCIRRCSSAPALSGTGIQHDVADVGQQVREQDQERDDQEDSLHQRVVVVGDRLEET